MCFFFFCFYLITFFYGFCHILWQIGAVNGTEEFKLGVTMNADMKGITYASVKHSGVNPHPCNTNDAKHEGVHN